MNKKDLLFEAILSFLLECEVESLTYADYNEVIRLVCNGAKIDAIKRLRDVTRREIVPAVNSCMLPKDNEFHNMLVSVGHPLVAQTKTLSLKRAKDIVDVIVATTF